MSGYQFVHIDTYPLTSTKNKPSMVSIVSEAARIEGYCPHVKSPEKPILLHGIEPTALTSIVTNRVKQARDKSGRKIRSDAPVLLAGVASLPAESSKKIKLFIDKTIHFLRKKYGDNLMSVVLHLDESPYPHVHFYAIPSVEQGGFSMSQIHCGIKARNECNGGYSKKAVAYKDAMRKFQDEYYAEVSSNIGLTRLGPRVQRLSRKQWKAQQAQATLLSNEKLRISKASKELINREKVLVKSSRTLQLRETSLTTIEKSSFFQKTNEKKNRHLRKRLTNITNLLQDKTTEVEEFKQTLSSLRQEISKLKSQNASFNARFDALRYKNDVKDRRIKELTYNNNNKGHYNETRISVSPSHRRF